MGIEDIYTKIQDILSVAPLVIWNSEVTITFGSLNMSKLKDEIGRALPSFDKPFTDI